MQRRATRRPAAVAIALVAMATAPAAWASHVPGHGGGGGLAGGLDANPFSDRSERPRNRLGLAGRYTRLAAPDRCPDDGRAPDDGSQWTWSAVGEWSPIERFSLSLGLPVGTVDSSCGGRSGTGLGDLSLSLKGVLWHALDGRLTLQGGGELDFPTGDEELGLGTGEVGWRTFAGVSVLGERLGAFADGAVSARFEDATGVEVELGAGGAWFLPYGLTALLELRGLVQADAPARESSHGALAGRVPVDGDASLFLGPGLTYTPAADSPDGRWIISVTSRLPLAGDPRADLEIGLGVDWLF